MLIRSLSVFVSQLESICGPGEANYDLCIQASKAISRTLDEVLDPPQYASTPAPATPAQSAVMNDNLGMMDLDVLNPESWENFDLSAWAKNIDWTSTGGEWSTF